MDSHDSAMEFLYLCNRIQRVKSRFDQVTISGLRSIPHVILIAFDLYSLRKSRLKKPIQI